MGNLDNRIAVITGAAQGIGNGSAKVLAGIATVILIDFAESVEAAAEELRAMGYKAAAKRVNVAVQKTVDEIVADPDHDYSPVAADLRSCAEYRHSEITPVRKSPGVL